jgi:hypothetical protein
VILFPEHHEVTGMARSMCAVEGCNSFPVWEIVWSNGRLYDVCDEHAGMSAPWSIEDRGDGSLHVPHFETVTGAQLSAR